MATTISSSAPCARPIDLRRLLRITALPLAMWLVAGPATAEVPVPTDLPDDLREWRAGPVKYLITGREDRTFKHLERDEERRAFIREFWERRDPTPGTPENELYELFRRRVEEANRSLTATTTIGWKTDRGRIYILLGPPDEIEVDPVQKAGRGQIRWIYRGAPTAESGPNQIIAFREDASGEYRTSDDPSDYGHIQSFVTRFSILLNPTVEAIDQLRLQAPESENQLREQVADMTRAPSEEDLLAAIVRADDRPEAFPFLPRFDYYRSEHGLTFVAINVGVMPAALPPGADPGALLPVARLERAEEPPAVYDFVYRNPFAPAPDNEAVSASGYHLFQAGQGIPPGRYRCYVGVFERAKGEVASRWVEIDVPAFPEDGLSLSSLTLVRRAEPLGPHEADGPFKRPFVLAGRRVIPRLETSFRNGETFSVYYQIYGAQVSSSGERDLHAEYRFSVLQDGEYVPIGPPVPSGPIHEAAVGWTFPLSGWPVARFRLEVVVSDRAGGQTARAVTEFTVDG